MMFYKYLTILILLFFFVFSEAANISGYVSSKESGEPLAYTTIYVKGTNLGAYSNKKGYFVINSIPEGECELIAQLIGYHTFQQKVTISDPRQSEFVKIELKRASIELQGITVEDSKYYDVIDFNAKEIRVGNIRQSTENILDLPQVADADVFRSLQNLPGISSIADFSSGLYVRGGTQDQNLILLDDVDVYNPTHFAGLFSTFNADAIENVELLKGGFPAKFGGRLSSVLDITNREGNRKKFHGIARTSIISSNMTHEGPWKIGNQSGSYMGSFRRTYLELVKDFFNLPDYYFYDGHMKINWDISTKDRVTNSFYFGKDRLFLEFGDEMEICWGNETFSSQWVHVFNPTLFSQFIVAGSHYGSLFEITSDADVEMKRKNDVYDVSMKGMLNYKPNESHKVDFGFETKYNQIKSSFTSKNVNLDSNSFPDLTTHSITQAVYAQDTWDINPFWTLQPGLRVSLFHSTTDDLKNAPDADYLRFSPRLSLRYKVGLVSSIYANYGRYYQFLTSVNLGVSSPIDLWFPLDGNVDPGISNHYILGFNSQLNNYLAFEVEGYYKDYNNLVEYRIETDYEWDNETGSLKDIYNMGKGFSYGGDVLLRNNYNGIEGFLGYSFGITKRKIENVNVNPETDQSEYYFPKFDRTHQINLVQTVNISRVFSKLYLGSEMKLGTSFAYYTGQPTGKPEKYYTDGNSIQILYSYSDRERLPAYSRLDVSLRMKWQIGRFGLEPYIEIINVLNNKNVWSAQYIPRINSEDNHIELEEKHTGMFPFLPFIGINVEF
ncbi:MAG: TonB-dependent receptor [Candidatus Cloacimonetes bacterium]|nr:TonB-dependent receptor [Candidatus Cloacimonadota bacterium]